MWQASQGTRVVILAGGSPCDLFIIPRRNSVSEVPRENELERQGAEIDGETAEPGVQSGVTREVDSGADHVGPSADEDPNDGDGDEDEADQVESKETDRRSAEEHRVAEERRAAEQRRLAEVERRLAEEYENRFMPWTPEGSIDWDGLN